jgi:hypothetical protein
MSSGGVAFVKPYRIYCFDGASKIIRAESLDAGDDDEAVSAAKRVDGCVRLEVWDRDRLVARVAPSASH